MVNLIKSGSYIDIFYAKTCATTKIRTVAGYHVVLATLLFLLFLKINIEMLNKMTEFNPY